MFYDLSLRKMMPLLLLATILIASLTGFLWVNGTFNLVGRSLELYSREQADFAYEFFYRDSPEEAAAADATSTPGDARAIPVLIYHGTPPEGNDNAPLPLNVFTEQLQALKADGWHTITIEQFQAFMKDGEALPAKSFLLTFDDGRRESFYPADPVLQDLGYTAVMFVITGFSLPNNGNAAINGYYLDKSELQYMVDSGRWEIESHGDEDHALYDVPSATSTNGTLATLTQQHFLSNKFWLPSEGHVETTAEYQQRVTNDLEESKETLEQDFGKPVIAFAYPFNDYGQDTVNYPNAVNDLSNIVPSIYQFAFYQVNPAGQDPFNYPDPAQYMVKRIEPTASMSGADLVALLDDTAPKSLPYRNGPTWDDWNGNWGSVTTAKELLILQATAKTSGAAALLDGSAWWSDYDVTASVRWEGDAEASLIARYESDSRTFLSCAFGSGAIYLESHDNGQQTTLATGSYDASSGTQDETISMSVEGNTAACSIAGASINASLPASFVHPGSTGIEVWDPTVGSAGAQVQSVSVESL